MKKEKKKKKKKKEKASQALTQEAVNTSVPETEDAVLEAMLRHIGGKWKIRILCALQDGQSKRYSTLKSNVSSITDMMLSQSLKELMASGMVERHQFQEIPPRVEYQITKKGLTFIPIIKDCISWTKTSGFVKKTK